MIQITRGNLLESDAQALVNAVNCVGVMGKGIALQFKQAFPENFKAYEKACKQKSVVPGKMFVFSTGNSGNPRFVINFPTKRHWRDKSRLEDVQSGLVDLVNVIKESNIESIALPPLGCGLGGLEWGVVKSLIEEALADLSDVKVLLFSPEGS